MGGLGRSMPITFATFLIATLAIAGIPPLAGFFSKDEILWQAFSSPHGSRRSVARRRRWSPASPPSTCSARSS